MIWASPNSRSYQIPTATRSKEPVMKLYKLTDGKGATRRNMVWGPGVTNSVAPRVDGLPRLGKIGRAHV